MLSQVDKLYNLLRRRKAVRTDEILLKVYGDKKRGIARISARIFDVKRKYGKEIIGWRDRHDRTLYWYAMEKDNTIID